MARVEIELHHTDELRRAIYEAGRTLAEVDAELKTDGVLNGLQALAECEAVSSSVTELAINRALAAVRLDLPVPKG